MDREIIIEEVYEIAYGDNAIARVFTNTDVLAVLKKDSEEAYLFEQVIELINNGGEQ